MVIEMVSEKKEKRVEFVVQVDKAGRIMVPPHVRRDIGIYGKAARAKVWLEVEKLYEGSGEQQE